MMKLKQLPFLTLLLVSLLSSCTMQKRLYRPGYYSSFKKNAAIKDLHRQHTNVPVVAESISTAVRSDEMPVCSPVPVTAPAQTPKKNNDLRLPALPTAEKENTHSTSLKGLPEKVLYKDNSFSIPQKKLRKPATGRYNDGGGRIIRGLLMIILGFILIGLGFIFLNALGVLGIIFLLIFGISGALFIIRGIFALFP